jgi:hypothetical protein
MTKPSAKKTTTDRKQKARRERDVSKIDLPGPEAVARHALFGTCDFTLLDPGEDLPKTARYAFNVAGSPRITFVDHAGDETGSSPPEMNGGGFAKA